MRRSLRELWRQQSGMTTVEYGMMMALVAVAAIFAWRHLGRHVLRVAWKGCTAVGPYATP